METRQEVREELRREAAEREIEEREAAREECKCENHWELNEDSQCVCSVCGGEL